MLNYIKSEVLKQKNTFNNRIIGIMSLTAILVSLMLMPPVYVQTFSYNIWYITFLPFTFTFMAVSIMKKDVKHNYHGLLGIIEQKKQLWYAKTFVATGYLFMACLIFFIEMALCGIIFTRSISIFQNITASLLLFITFAWQLPFYMVISQKISLFVSVILSMVCNIAISCICAVKTCWWIPFAIPARIMCPVIGVMPNALPVESNSIYENSNVILPGIVITVVLYLVLTVVGAKIFEKQEV